MRNEAIIQSSSTAPSPSLNEEIDLQFAPVTNSHPPLSLLRVLTRPVRNNEVAPRELFRRRFAEGTGQGLREELFLGLLNGGRGAGARIITGDHTISPENILPDSQAHRTLPCVPRLHHSDPLSARPSFSTPGTKHVIIRATNLLADHEIRRAQAAYIQGRAGTAR